MAKNQLVILGTGGHAIACLDLISADSDYEIIGFVSKEIEDRFICNLPIVGCDDDIPLLIECGKKFVLGIGQIHDHTLRKNIWQKVTNLNGQFPGLISSSSTVSRHATIGQATQVMNGAHVGPGTSIGVAAIINTHAIVEHGSIVGDFVHVSTGAIINGNVTIGSGTFVGSNAVIAHNVTIGDCCIISAGSKIFSDVPNGTVVR